MGQFKLMCLWFFQVREGMWEDQAAVYKVWDLGDSLEPLAKMQIETHAYHKLRSLQASWCLGPKHRNLVCML